MTGKVDLIVVGSGGAGLVASLAAASRGAKVTVLERAPVFGGTTAISGGGAWLPGNRAGVELGFEDSEDEVRTYLQRVTFGRVASGVLDAFIRYAPQVYDFLSSQTPLVLDGTRVSDYLTNLPGAKVAGRQIATGLYDLARLGEWADLVRMGPYPGGIAYVTQAEKERLTDLTGIARERRENGMVGRGHAFVGGLVEANLKRGVELIANARVVGLTVTRGRVSGVEVERAGTQARIAAQHGVVLASGGFEWNRQMWDSLLGVPLDGPLSPPYNHGDGLRMAAQAGARLGNVNQAWWMPAVGIPGETYDGEQRLRMSHHQGFPGSIIVNRRGKRFGNESMNYHDFGKLMVAFDPATYEFPNVPSYQVFDSAHMERYPILEWDKDTKLTPDWLFEAPTLRKLAERIGVDPGEFQHEVNQFNRHAAAGVDPVFHRGGVRWERKKLSWERYRDLDDPFDMSSNPTIAPLLKPPFFAFENKVGTFGTNGGPVINENGQVVDYDNRPIPGLFAAGNVTASIFGLAYPGGGATLGPALTFGYIAGVSATPD